MWTSENVKPPEINNFEEFIKAVRASGLVGLGGADAAEALSQIMGVSCESVEVKVAYNHCQGGCGNTEKKYEYEGYHD